MNPRTLRTLLLAVPLLTAWTGGELRAGDDKFCKTQNVTVQTGETRRGDLYFLARNTVISGTHEGDLIGLTSSASISGEVTGDVMLLGQTIEISGVVRDSARIWSQSVTISGELEGDLLSLSATTNIRPDAHIGGKAIILGGTSILDGTIVDGVKVTSGEVILNGTVLSDVEVKADRISLGPNARIEGDLIYTARKELEIENADAVMGEIIFKEQVDEDEEENDPLLSASGFFWWGWSVLAAILVGFVVLALFRPMTPALTRSIDGEPMLGTLIGFGSFLVVPAACLLAILLVISLPLGVMTLGVFAITLYLAKLPVALWIGERILASVGRPGASPFLALAIGLVLLYLVFAIPFYVGFLLKLAATWLGLGTIILTIRNRTQPPETPAAAG